MLSVEIIPPPTDAVPAPEVQQEKMSKALHVLKPSGLPLVDVFVSESTTVAQLKFQLASQCELVIDFLPKY